MSSHSLFNSKTRCNRIFLLSILLFVLQQPLAFPNQNLSANNSNRLIEQQVDSIFDQLRIAFGQNIDSLFLHTRDAEKFLIQHNQIPKLIDLHSFLSEVYQFRIIDYVMALHHVKQAINLIADNPQYNINNPYMYINAGNILLNFEFFQQSVLLYEKALEIALEIEDPYVIVLVYNNIAISKRNQGDCTEAQKYFELALKNIPDPNDLLVSRTKNYLARLFLRCDNTNAVPNNVEESLNVLKEFYKNAQYSNFEDLERRMIDYHELQMDVNFIKSRYHFAVEQIDTGIYYQQQAIKYARKTHNHFHHADMLYQQGLNMQELGYTNQAISYFEQAVSLMINTTDYSRLRDLNNALFEAHQKKGEYSRAALFERNANLYLDSLFARQTSVDINQDKISLANFDLMLSIMNMENAQIQYKQTIIRQRRIIVQIISGISAIVFMASITLILLHRLKKIRISLARRTIEAIKDTQEKKPQNSSGIPAGMMEAFEKEVLQQKAFLKPDLNLKSMACLLNSNPTYVSQLINQHYGESFTEFINNLRIKEACKIIDEELNNAVIIDELYSRVGFRGKSTFYNAFKKYTGVSPAMYIKISQKK